MFSLCEGRDVVVCIRLLWRIVAIEFARYVASATVMGANWHAISRLVCLRLGLYANVNTSGRVFSMCVWRGSSYGAMLHVRGFSVRVRMATTKHQRTCEELRRRSVRPMMNLGEDLVVARAEQSPIHARKLRTARSQIVFRPSCVDARNVSACVCACGLLFNIRFSS